MKRRSFFNKLLAGGVGLAIAPKLAAELAKDPETYKRLDPETEFSVDDLDKAIRTYSQDNHLSFYGRRIRWTSEGKILCVMDGGVLPQINDVVLLNLIDDHHLPIMAAVTSIDRESNDIRNTNLRVVSMITLDKKDADKMLTLISNHQEVAVWSFRGGWNVELIHNDAFKGFALYSAWAENLTDKPERMYPMTYRDVYRDKYKEYNRDREGHMNIHWGHL